MLFKNLAKYLSVLFEETKSKDAHPRRIFHVIGAFLLCRVHIFPTSRI